MKFFIFFTFLLISPLFFCQALRIDPTFNPGDTSGVNGNGPDNIVYSSIIQPNGKIIVAGQFNSYNGIPVKGIVRINQNGTIDYSFHFDDNYHGFFQSIKLLNNGQLIVGGLFLDELLNQSKSVLRLNSDGSVDPTFNSEINNNGVVRTLWIQQDNKIVVGGDFLQIQGYQRNGIARLNPDGSLDTLFTGFNNFFPNSIYSVNVQPDGKVLLGGIINIPNYSNLSRLNANGTIDTSFQINSIGQVNTILVQPNGKILVGGNFNFFNGITSNRILRLNSDGSLDTNFILNQGFNARVNSLYLETNGEIVVAGNFTQYNGTFTKGAARLTSTGTLSNLFNINTFDPGVMTIAEQSDGKLIFGGFFAGNLTRTYANGDEDFTFNPVLSANGIISKSILQADGKIVIFGSFDRYDNVSTSNFIRLHVDGSLDTSFNSTLGPSTTLYDMKIQSDGKILVGGTHNGAFYFLKRMNIDGSLDTTFNPIMTAYNSYIEINSISVQPDGKLIVGGIFEGANGFLSKNIARLNPDGSTDTSFYSAPDNYNHKIKCASLLPNGQIIIGGDISTYQGIPVNNVARLNTNGSLDTSFSIGNGGTHTMINQIFILPTGKILLSGNFSMIAGYNRNNFARLNANGSLDTTFQCGLPTVISINNATIDTTGKIIAVGEFYPNIDLNYQNMLRLNTNGTIDTTLIIGFGPNDGVNNIHIQPDGKMIISGGFVNFNGDSRKRIARLEYCTPPSRPEISTFAPFSLCFSDTATLTSSLGSYYFWNTGETTQSIFVTYWANYSVIIKDSLKCVSQVSEQMNFNNNSVYTSISAISCDTFELNGQLFPTNGMYTQILTRSNGCDSVIYLNLTTLPTPQISLYGATLFTNITGATYQWINCLDNEPIPGATFQTYDPTTTGDYAVIVHYNGCVGTSNCLYFDLADLHEFNLNEQIQIFPNPSTGLYTISSSTSIDQLKIYNSVGEIILTNRNSATFNLSNQKKGIYIVEISAHGTTTMKRVVLN